VDGGAESGVEGLSAAGVELSVVGAWLVEIHTLAGGAEAPQSAECIFIFE